MKIAGQRTDAALFLDYGVCCQILKDDRISAPLDRTVADHLGPWTEIEKSLARRRAIEDRALRARYAPLGYFVLGGPGSGNFGHGGRPGQQGGSGGGEGDREKDQPRYAGPRRDGAGAGVFGKVHEKDVQDAKASAFTHKAGKGLGEDPDDHSVATGKTARTGGTHDVTPAIEGKPPGRLDVAARERALNTAARAAKQERDAADRAAVRARLGISGERAPATGLRARAIAHDAAAELKKAERGKPVVRPTGKIHVESGKGPGGTFTDTQKYMNYEIMHGAKAAAKKFAQLLGKKLSDDPATWPRPTAAEIDQKIVALRAIDAAAPPAFGGKAAPLFEKKLSEESPAPTKAITIGKRASTKKPMQKAALVVKPTQAPTAIVTKPLAPPKPATPKKVAVTKTAVARPQIKTAPTR